MNQSYEAGWRPPAPATDPPAPHQEAQRSLLRRLLGPLVVVGALLLKFGKAALLILPKAKVLTTSASMLVSVAAYSFIWGWKFALGFVLLLLVHEMGHVIQLRREGVPASAPLFIPFLGAVVAAKSLGRDAAAEARVGLAGPVLGTLGTAALVPVALASGDPFWKALAFTGFFLNLFNLVPVAMLDGGRAFAAMAPWMWFVGLAMAVGLVFVMPNPILFLIVLVGVLDTWRRWKAIRAGDPETKRYYQVRPATRLAVGAVYVGLIVACVVGMDATFVERSLDDV
ncbi:MAG: site-2 protease family protein [Actinomycetota bacterium]|nr:site-2 protease family protein [Actinomycetota bacterium]